MATHSSVEKLTEIGDRQIAVMTHGLGAIASRTILSLVREFEFAEYAKDPAPIRTWSVQEFCAELMAFVKQRYDGAFPPPGQNADDHRHSLGIVVGGYSPGAFFPEVFELTLPDGKVVQRLEMAGANQQGFWFVDFWGVRTALNRLLFGYDLSSLMSKYGFLCFARDERNKGNPNFAGAPDPPAVSPQDALFEIGPMETIDHRLNGMPLQEAVEFADYLGMVAIGYDRFTEGPPSVGGELDVLAIQPEGLSWYKRKPFASKMAEARDRRNTRR